VDPRVYPGQSGLPQDSSNGEESVNYLRRLKGGVAEGAPANASASKGRDPADPNRVDWTLRRQSPRLRCSGSVEFRAQDSNVRMWGTLTDVSLHGCYVEMNATSPAGAKVDLVLKSFGIRIEVSGTVRTSYPFLGMGICFDEIAPAQLLQLKQLLNTLTGRSALSVGMSARQNSMKDTPPADPGVLLDEIAEFFQRKQHLSRDEFHQIAQRVRRSRIPPPRT
jgi:hypothetical protein